MLNVLPRRMFGCPDFCRDLYRSQQYLAFNFHAHSQAMPHKLKALAVKLFGRLYVPVVPVEAGFFRGRSRRIVASLGRRVPGWTGHVCAVGGLDSINAMEAAMDEGFGLVQAARALIRDPAFVRKTEQLFQEPSPSQQHAGAGKTETAKSGAPFSCIHCNMFVVATLNPNQPMSCPERRKDPVAEQF